MSTAAYAPHPWPVPTGAARPLPWIFGHELVLNGLPGAPRALQWRLWRASPVTPRDAIRVYSLLSAASLAVAAFYAAVGAPYVLAMAAAQLVALGTAVLVYSRHCADGETITLVGRSLQVEQRYGARLQRTDFAAEWLRVEPAAAQGSLVQLSARGQRVRVGRFLRPELRGAFARELRLALRRPTATPAIPTEWPPQPD